MSGVRIGLLLTASVASVACDPPTQGEAPSARPVVSHPSAPQPIADKDPQLTTKFRPSVIDLGGIKAAKAVGCALTVFFSSIGTGTDGQTGARIRQLLEEDSGVAEIEPFIVGREGETVLCVRLNLQGDADRLFDKLREAAEDSYLVTIRTSSGREFRSARSLPR
jgi:hypothetical protein